MKRIIKYSVLLFVVVSTMTACKVWEEKWDVVIPLPETEIPIDIDPWEPDGLHEDVGH